MTQMAGDNPEMENQRIQWKLTKRKQQTNQMILQKKESPNHPNRSTPTTQCGRGLRTKS